MKLAVLLISIFISLNSLAQVACSYAACTNTGYSTWSVTNWNGTGLAVLAPTGSAAQMNSLANYPPAGVSVSGCVCGWGGGCTYTNYNWVGVDYGGGYLGGCFDQCSSPLWLNNYVASGCADAGCCSFIGAGCGQDPTVNGHYGVWCYRDVQCAQNINGSIQCNGSCN